MKKHPILHDYDDHYDTPMQVIEALEDAGREMSYSNYHNRQFQAAIKIIRQWAKANKVPIGLRRETLERKRREAEDAKFAKYIKQAEDLLGPINWDGKLE